MSDDLPLTFARTFYERLIAGDTIAAAGRRRGSSCATRATDLAPRTRCSRSGGRPSRLTVAPVRGRCWDAAMLRPTLALAMLLIAPVTADAAKVQDTFYNSVIPSRVDHLIGFAPTSFGIHPRDEPLRPLTVRVRGRTYRYLFSTAAAVVAASPNIYLRNMIRQRPYPSLQGVFLDRRLTAAERRHVVVRADLGRDADVLAVASGHPACASGVSRAVARGIAKGTIRSWSAAGVPTPASGTRCAPPRRGRGRAVVGAALRRRLPGTEERADHPRRRLIGGRVRQPGDRGGD